MSVPRVFNSLPCVSHHCISSSQNSARRGWVGESHLFLRPRFHRRHALCWTGRCCSLEEQAAVRATWPECSGPATKRVVIFGGDPPEIKMCGPYTAEAAEVVVESFGVLVAE